MGHLTPILAISEGGSIQDIFSILKAGAYDYIETIDNTRKYKKKIENLILWNWYIKKHTSAKKRQCWEGTRETLLLFFCLFGKNYINTRFFYKRTKWELFCSNVLVNKWKEIPIMKSKNLKNQPAKVLANLSLKLGKMSADSACCYIYHQPKMPEALKKMKKL